MTTSDPFGTPPQKGQPPYGQPDGPPAADAAPQYGAGPGYGQPQYGADPGYGQPQYGAPTYGQAPSPFGQPGGPQLAGWLPRVGASLLDNLALMILYYVPIGLGFASGDNTIATVMMLVGLVAGFAFFIWNHVRQGRTGQTIGKGLVGISLRREQDGQVVGAGLSIGRSFVHILDALPCYVGFLWPLWDAKKQTFADKILSTVVVKV